MNEIRFVEEWERWESVWMCGEGDIEMNELDINEWTGKDGIAIWKCWNERWEVKSECVDVWTGKHVDLRQRVIDRRSWHGSVSQTMSERSKA